MRRLLPIVLAAALAGCGQERSRPPDVRHPDSPNGTRKVTLRGAGVSFTAPQNWSTLDPEPPLEGGLTSKSATVAVWRYPRTEPLPAGPRELEQARDRLIERIRQRNATFEVASSELTEVDGARGIELTGTQTIRGLTYEVRSAHLFADGAELVVDAYAFPEDFERIDETVFAPLIESLEFSG